jgi:hypothetical protein
MDKKSIENRKRCANTLRRFFITEAVAQGLTRHLELTWDGGHQFPNVFDDLHVAEFHARGKVVRESITEGAIIAAWRTDDSLGVIRRAVAELLKC